MVRNNAIVLAFFVVYMRFPYIFVLLINSTYRNQKHNIPHIP